jgi:hypothetical protein
MARFPNVGRPRHELYEADDRRREIDRVVARKLADALAALPPAKSEEPQTKRRKQSRGMAPASMAALVAFVDYALSRKPVPKKQLTLAQHVATHAKAAKLPGAELLEPENFTLREAAAAVLELVKLRESRR